MHLKLSLLVILSAALFKASAQTPPTENQNAEKVRVERLVGLAKVWGTVKYFHPFLAYREIDWDQALIETIPQVNRAKTPQEYSAAINSMLAALGDKITRAEIITEKPKTTNQVFAREMKEPIFLQNGILTVDGYAVAAAIAGANNLEYEFVEKTIQLAPQAKAVFIDLRSPKNAEGDAAYYVDNYLRAILPTMLDKNVPLSAVRYRMHNGYASQTGGGASFYYSAMMTTEPKTLAGNNTAKTPPIIFLVNENSVSTEMLSGLQTANLAFVVQDGAAQETGAATATIKLPDTIEVTMRTAELINPNGTIGFAADVTAPKGEAMRTAQRIITENKFVSSRPKSAPTFAPQVSQKEKTYAEMEFPTAEYRLLALFRFWNVINYFYPYKDLLDERWETVLPKFIPKFEANRDTADYQITVREMAAEVQDSHVGVGNTLKVPDRLGKFYPQFSAKFIEGQSVVTGVFDERVGIKSGDAILSVDGEPVEKYREKLSHNYAASTPQAMQRILHFNFLRGQKDTPVKLTVRGLDGKTREVEATRTIDAADPKRQKAGYSPRTSPVVQVLPDGFGYVDLARLTVAEVDKMFETIKNTPAAIFDMRGYPNGTAWAIAPRLTTKKSPIGALFSRPILEATSLSDGESTAFNYAFAQKLPAAKGDIYTGKVVMLINEDAISQAEHTCLFFEAATDVTFVGTPTMGANGDVTFTVLPGNLPVSFTGHDVRHADGRQLQRVGILPTVKAAPTIRGTLAGRDEILEAAIEFLRSSKSKP